MFILKNLNIEAKRSKLMLNCESSEAKRTCWLVKKTRAFVPDKFFSLALSNIFKLPTLSDEENSVTIDISKKNKVNTISFFYI